MSMEKLITLLKPLEAICVGDLVIRVGDRDGDARIVVQNEPKDGNKSLVTEVVATLRTTQPYGEAISVDNNLFASDWMLYQTVGTNLVNKLKERANKETPYADSITELAASIDSYVTPDTVFGTKRLLLFAVRVLDSLYTHLFPYTSFTASIDTNEQESSVSYMFKRLYDIRMSARCANSGIIIELIDPNSTSGSEAVSFMHVNVKDTDSHWFIKPDCFASYLLKLVDAVALYQQILVSKEKHSLIESVGSISQALNALQTDVESVKKSLKD